MLYYSDYLKRKYGERVYKLPVNIRGTCPNRDGSKGMDGCIYCGVYGAGFESLPPEFSVTEQLERNRAYIGKKYKAKKFIAYFQNYSNTYMPLEDFKKMISEACLPYIVEISISTRPDCIKVEQLEFLKTLEGVNISFEIGLQSANDRTLELINRKHSVKDYIDAAKQVRDCGFEVCTHVITNFPWDTREDIIRLAEIVNEYSDGVKMHSLYVVKGTKLEEMYKSGEFVPLDYEEYLYRTVLFLKNLKPDMVIHRLMGRAPKEFTLFENYNKSWWRIKDDILNLLKDQL